jgi:ketosteroid isomerase-like protein
VRYYQDWASAGQADDLPAASAAYAQLVAALDAELEDLRLDPIRDAVIQIHDQFGEDWPFGPLPIQPDR